MGDEEIVSNQASIKEDQKAISLTENIGEYSTKYSGWSLRDVLKHSPEASSKSGVIDVHTAMDGVSESMIRVDCSENFNINFSVTDGESLKEKIVSKLTRNEIDIKTEDTEEGTVVDAGTYGKYSIGKPNESSLANVNITFPDKSDEGKDVVDALIASGLSDMLKLNDIPDKPEAAIQKKYVEFWDGRTISVLEAKSVEDAESLLEPQEEGKIRLVHGTSFERAMNIAQEGVFGEDKPNQDNPTLTEGFDYAHEAATAKTEGIGWQAYLVMQCEPDDYTNQGGYGENIGLPAKKFEGDRGRLDFLDVTMQQSPNLTHISADRIKQLILLKEKI